MRAIMTALPPLYLSHGSPMIAIERSPASDFLHQLGERIERTFGRPRAALVVSPHTATRRPVVLADRRHAAIHDFGGFPAELYEQQYDAQGDPQLAVDVARRLTEAGIATEAVAAGGLDHGIWTLLKRMWPGAEVPVVPLSLVPNWTPQQQWAIGQALAPLADDGVLIIGSGAMTHNLRRFFGSRGDKGAAVSPDVAAFQNWVTARGAARDWEALWDYRRQAPHAVDQHPTDEHWLPFYVAAGAGGADHGAVRIHDSVDAGLLAMDGFAFGPQAARLLAA
jgi:4,5-DOPA dioxygenase extradiol